jgi:hypothetical protein
VLGLHHDGERGVWAMSIKTLLALGLGTCSMCEAIWDRHRMQYPLPQAAIRHFRTHQNIQLEDES